MTEQQQNALRDFETIVKQLLLQHKLLKEELVEMQCVLEEKDATIVKLRNSLAESQKQYADLKLAKMMELDDEDVKNAKQNLSKLIREVDKCIALLNV